MASFHKFQPTSQMSACQRNTWRKSKTISTTAKSQMWIWSKLSWSRWLKDWQVEACLATQGPMMHMIYIVSWVEEADREDSTWVIQTHWLWTVDFSLINIVWQAITTNHMVNSKIRKFMVDSHTRCLRNRRLIRIIIIPILNSWANSKAVTWLGDMIVWLWVAWNN